MNNNQTTKLQHFIKNYIWIFTHTLITTILPFLVRTIMIQKWGLEYAGMNGLFSSVMQILSIAELGMGSALLYSMYKPMALGDVKQVNALLNLYRCIYRILGVCVLILGIGMMPFLKYTIQGSWPEGINIYVVYLIQLANTVVGYIAFTYWNAILQADQRVDIDYKIGLIITFAMYVIQIMVIYRCQNYYLYLVWLPLATLTINIVRAVYVQRMYPEIRCEGMVERSFIKEYFKRVLGMAISKVRTTIRITIDSIAISSNLGLLILAQYQNYYQLVCIPILLVNIIKGAIIPSFGISVATESKQKNYQIFQLYTFVDNWIATWATVCLLCLSQNFMCLWLGMNNVLEDRIVILFCIYFYLYSVSENALMLREATGLWWIGKEGAIIESVGNVVLNMILVKHWGMGGVIIATIMTLLFINIPIEIIAIFKGYFGMFPYEYILKQGHYAFNTLIICVITGWVCKNFLIGDFKSLLLEMLICMFLPNILYIVLNCYRREFREIFHLLTQCIKKRGKTK